MLNTTCSLDQIMAATKVVDPITYGELIGKYNSEPRWVQGGIVYHMNLLLQKPPAERQAEVNTLVGHLPRVRVDLHRSGAGRRRYRGQVPDLPGRGSGRLGCLGTCSGSGRCSGLVQRAGDLLGHPSPVQHRRVGV